MVYDTGYKIKHVCNILDFCIIDDDTQLLFCFLCKKIVGIKKGEEILLGDVIDVKTSISDHKQKEYDKEKIKEWV